VCLQQTTKPGLLQMTTPMSPPPIDWEALARAAAAAREKAYAPYSGFAIGAAALFADGELTSGCNVENASYGLGVCAERNALAAGVLGAHGRLRAVLVLASSARPVPPCGACRQVLAEFGGPELPVQSRTLGGSQMTHTLGSLLPEAFGPDWLGR
jgi:cytidine deaminase